FLLMGDVASLASLTEAIALDGRGQDHRRRTGMLDGRLEGGVDLFRIVAAPGQLAKLLVGKVLDHLQQLGVLAKEVLADVGPRLDGVLLILAVDDLAHAFDEHTVFVAGQEGIPVAAPDDLDAVPAGAAEGGLQLLDDFAVAAYRAVE